MMNGCEVRLFCVYLCQRTGICFDGMNFGHSIKSVLEILSFECSYGLNALYSTLKTPVCSQEV